MNSPNVMSVNRRNVTPRLKLSLSMFLIACGVCATTSGQDARLRLSVDEDVVRGLGSMTDGEDDVPTPQLAVGKSLSSRPMLIIDYPWRHHRRASVEVMLMPDRPLEYVERPIFFRHQFERAEWLIRVGRARDAAERGTVSSFLRTDDLEFQLIGGGTPSGGNGLAIVDDAVVEGVAQPKASFFPLEDWAVDERRLYVEPPAAYFEMAGSMRVWFLREGTIIWSDVVSWPGVPGAPQNRPAAEEAKGN